MTLTQSHGDAYWQRYGLSCDPFLTNDSYFPVSTWEKHLDLFHYLSRYGHVLITLVGPQGSGKSTLIRQFLDQIQVDNYYVQQLDATPALNLATVADLLQDGLNLPNETASTPLEIIEQQLEWLTQYDERCLIIINHAEILTDAVLIDLCALCCLQADLKNSRLQIMLCGDETFEQRLEDLTRQRQQEDRVYTLVIEPLTQQQVQQFIAFRFQEAGLVGELPLQQGQIKKIWQQSKGLPGYLHRACSDVLMRGVLSDEQVEKGSDTDLSATPSRLGAIALYSAHLWKVKKKTILFGCFLLITASLVLHFDRSKLPKKATSLVQVLPFSQKSSHAWTQIKKDLSKQSSVSSNKIAANKKKGPAVLSSQSFTLKPKGIKKKNKLVKKVKVKHKQAVKKHESVKVVKATVKPKQAVEKHELPKVATVHPKMKQSTSVSKHVKELTKPPVAKTVVKAVTQSKPKQAGKVVKSAKDVAQAALSKAENPKVVSAPARQSQVGHAKKPKTEKKPVKIVKKGNYSHDETFLLKQEPASYTLQLMASVNKKKLLSEAKAVINKPRYATYLFRYGPNWHVLTFGVYSSLDKAKRAEKTLPKALKQLIKPWPRQLKDIQSEIKKPRV